MSDEETAIALLCEIDTPSRDNRVVRSLTMNQEPIILAACVYMPDGHLQDIGHHVAEITRVELRVHSSGAINAVAVGNWLVDERYQRMFQNGFYPAAEMAGTTKFMDDDRVEIEGRLTRVLAIRRDPMNTAACPAWSTCRFL